MCGKSTVLERKSSKKMCDSLDGWEVLTPDKTWAPFDGAEAYKW